jgi:hypothetical protein
MTTEPVDVPDDFERVVAQARRAAELAGELGPRAAGPYVSLLASDERDAVLGVLRDRSCVRAVAALTADDPDLATQ